MTPSVLFVDDDLAILQALMRRMRKEPFQLRTATSGEEALGILSRSAIDLIVSDMNMPGMSGLEFFGKVAKEHPQCIRIMLTGRPTLDAAMNAINTGQVYRFLTKPYDAGALAALIRDALEGNACLARTNQQSCPLTGRPEAQPGIAKARAIPNGYHTQVLTREDARFVPPDGNGVSPLAKDFLARLECPGSRASTEDDDARVRQICRILLGQ